MSFPNIISLRTYINTYINTNGVNEITGLENNTSLNGIIDYILNSMVNNEFVQIISTGGVVVLAHPMNFITVLPTSVQWPTNFQNEYYIVNALGVNIPLASGFTYTDAYGTVQTIIPARTAIHIAQATNGNWMQVNNAGGSGSAGLPPQAGHEGEYLSTGGTTPVWNDPHISLTSADFEADGKTYLNTRINVTNKVSIFIQTIPGFIYQSLGDWHYISGGFVIDLPWFNASTDPNLKVELFFKGINAA